MMNIFVTDFSPRQCAVNLDDKRVVKMILETAQMLSTAMYSHAPDKFVVAPYSPLVALYDRKGRGRQFIGFKKNTKVKNAYYHNRVRMPAPTHVNHPCNIWARETQDNFMWLRCHFLELCTEYIMRYGKQHSYHDFIREQTWLGQYYIPRGELTEFANCAAHNEKGISYKHINDVTKAYQLYLNDRWETDIKTPTWNGVEK